ncbi:MAG: thymidine kinase [Bacteroidetes bacterium]|nr:thymidine kinase [Bacteroidota bacterium]
MFLEQTKHYQPRKGWIEVICGSMFSGKTEELIRRLKRAQIARQRIEIFKPQIDKRYNETKIVSHDAQAIHSTPVGSAVEILKFATEMDVIGIDEAQFFDAALPDVCAQIANQGTRVILAGLDMDFTGKPFGSMPVLLAQAEYITKVHAICMYCGELAQFSHRTVLNEEQILLGEKDSYMPLCRACFTSETGKK